MKGCPVIGGVLKVYGSGLLRSESIVEVVF